MDAEDAFASYHTTISRLRTEGAMALLKHGALPDAALAAELASPGSDSRFGVSLVARPSKDVRAAIAELQQRLRQREPDQYYYPPHDLHLTLVEVCSSQPVEVAAGIGRRCSEQLPTLLQGSGPLRIELPMLVYDARACALNFMPTAKLAGVRSLLVERLGELGIGATPRYPPRSAHVTFMRYLHPLHGDPRGWVDYLAAIEPEPDLTWTIDALFVTWGASWYGMQTRIQASGPYLLSGA